MRVYSYNYTLTIFFFQKLYKAVMHRPFSGKDPFADRLYSYLLQEVAVNNK